MVSPALRRGVAASVLLAISLLFTPGCGDQFVPDPSTAGTCPLDPALVPTPEDLDGDGLSNEQEIDGYMIVVDSAGLGVEAGELERRHVTSDPECADSDADGLQDGVEYVYKTDPRSADTDGDGLTDNEEVRRWKTSPTSVDTDGDATGPDGLSAPMPLLFDGAEVNTLKTSPSLADTDGDNKTDFEEADDPLRHPLVAELPNVEAVFTGEVDVRLFIEYADTEGEETEYGNTFSTSRSDTSTTGSSTSVAETTAASAGGAGFFMEVQAGAASGGKAGAAKVLAGPVLEAGRQGACDLADGKDVNVGPISFGLDDLGAIGEGVQALAGESDKWLGAASPTDTLCAPASPETTKTTTQSFSQSSTTSSEETYSEILRTSRERTETASRGTVKVGAKFRNTGLSTFSLEDIFVTMLQWQQSPDPSSAAAVGAGTFRTLATLRRAPAPEGSAPLGPLTLSPGEISPVIELAATDVNPSVIKGFLARPRSVIYEPFGASLTNVDGIDFKFLTEQTFGRTASIVIDYGDGRLDRFQVATNVSRYSAADEQADPTHIEGELAGSTLGEILDLLGIPFTTDPVRPLPGTPDGGAVRELTVLSGLENNFKVGMLDAPDFETGAPGSASEFWVIYPSRTAQIDPTVSFDKIVVQHGDQIRLVWTQDRDGDGLFAAEEALLGTSDSIEDRLTNDSGAPVADMKPDGWDSDNDGLTDFVEAKLGWVVEVQTAAGIAWDALPAGDPGKLVRRPDAYRVFSNPTRPNADGDMLADDVERMRGTDPNNPDTDDDGIPDGRDGYMDAGGSWVSLATTPAGRLYVKPALAPGDVGPWRTAHRTLSMALSDAATRNDVTDPGYDPTARVSQIWVAAGTYTGAPFALVNAVSVYGGFQGFETRIGQRNADPLTNGTILTGSMTSILTSAGDVESFTILDGVSVINGGGERGGGLRNEGGSPVLRNVNFEGNTAEATDKNGRGGAVYSDGGHPTFESCRFSGNRAQLAGGALFLSGGSLTGCTLNNNAVTEDTRPVDVTSGFFLGGGAVCLWSNGAGGLDHDLLLRSCSFLGNGGSKTSNGGAVQVVHLDRDLESTRNSPTGPHVRIEDCDFLGNTSTEFGGALNLTSVQIDCEVIGTRFFDNQAKRGPALAAQNETDVGSGLLTGRLLMVNCTVAGNYGGAGVAGGVPSAAADLRSLSNATIDNCIFAGNSGGYRPTGSGSGQAEIGAISAGPFMAGEVLNLTPSLATATFGAVVTDPDGTMRITYTITGGRPEVGDTLTGEDSGASATIGRIIGPSDDLWALRAHLIRRSLVQEGIVTESGTGSPTRDPSDFVPLDLSQGNIQRTPPRFVDLLGGDLRLDMTSPVIDLGSNFVDVDLRKPGLQFLGPLDLAGAPRSVDGDANGSAIVDMGAYEYQPPSSP